MATASTISENPASPPAAAPPDAPLLVSLSPLAPDALEATLANLALAFPDQLIDVATPDPIPAQLTSTQFRAATYTPSAPTSGSWVLTAADFLNTYKLTQESHSTACLLLGPESQSLSPAALRALADAVLTNHADLTTPRYELGPRDGLVNSAILYPVTRALYGARARYPLAIDLAFSTRTAERLVGAAQRQTAAGQNAALLWPVAEAVSAGFTLAEVPAGPRTLPPPDATDLNAMLAQVAGSFFADIDAKAGFWQRARIAYPPRPSATTAPAAPQNINTPDIPGIQPMLDSFRLAYTNLHEIWSLVLPPNSLLGLKKLSLMPPSGFRMDDSLWARIVYDFILAYRLRTINRGHLLGALTPLYLAWVASHLILTASGEPTAEAHIEALAAAFEADKPYLVARWRWPDRFNP
jgi:hypothetical protein